MLKIIEIKPKLPLARMQCFRTTQVQGRISGLWEQFSISSEEEYQAEKSEEKGRDKKKVKNIKFVGRTISIKWGRISSGKE